ncbi:MAG: hypothetical protein ACRDYB_02470 [Acidimicrobiales bacterium]
MVERITGKELRQLASLAHMAQRSYRDTEPALAGRFQTAAVAAVHLAQPQERAERLAEIQHQLEQAKVALGGL